MKSTVSFDQNNTLVDRSETIVEFAKRFLKHFSNELAVSNVKEITQIIQDQDKGGRLDEPQAVSRELHKQLQWDRYVKIRNIEQFWKAEFQHSNVSIQG